MRKKSKSLMNVFYLPAIILFSILVVYPLMRGVFFSFTNWNGYSQSYAMVGIANYTRLFTDKNVWTAFFNTLIYGFGSTILQNIFGIMFALFLNSKFRGRSVTRAFIYLPVMVSALIMGYIMYFFVKFDGGALNDIRALMGMAPLDWMASPGRAVLIIVFVNTFQFLGVSMIIYLAGLQNIPVMYYEAATIDGANKWNAFIRITLPCLLPAITSSVMINLIGGLKLFDVIMALVGPQYQTNSLSTLVHRTYFGSENAGYASAIGLISFLFIMLASGAFERLFQKAEEAL